MKFVIISLSEASKLDFGGADKLTKSDHLVCVYAKGKKTITEAVEEELNALKAEVEFEEVAETSDIWLYVAYLMGFHKASKHDVFVVTKDKSKIPNKLTGDDVKVYTSFKSIVGSTGSSSGNSSKKKTSTSTTKKTSSSSSKKTSTSSTKKKTTSTKKKTTSSKKKDTDVIDVIGSFVSGDKKKAKEGLVDLAGQILGGK